MACKCIDAYKAKRASSKAYKRDPARLRKYPRQNYIQSLLYAASAAQFICLGTFCAGLWILPIYTGILPFGMMLICMGLLVVFDLHKWHLLLWDDLVPRRLAYYEVVKECAFLILLISDAIISERSRNYLAAPKSWKASLLLYVPLGLMNLVSVVLIFYAGYLIRRQHVGYPPPVKVTPEAERDGRDPVKTSTEKPDLPVAV